MNQLLQRASADHRSRLQMPSRSGILPARSLLWLVLLFVAGCGYTHGFLRDSHSLSVVNYQFSIKGERFLKTAFGSASQSSALCLIPRSSEGVYRDAMVALQRDANLAANQAVINLREDHATSFYLLWCTTELTISGDVFEFTPIGATSQQQANATGQSPGQVYSTMEQPATGVPVGMMAFLTACFTSSIAPSTLPFSSSEQLLYPCSDAGFTDSSGCECF